MTKPGTKLLDIDFSTQGLRGKISQGDLYVQNFVFDRWKYRG